MVGVDFGTSGTAAAWAPVDPSRAEPGEIFVFTQWPGGRPGYDNKTPTAVLQRVDDGEMLAFGFEALAKAAALRADRPGSGIRLVHGFKMSLVAPDYYADSRERCASIGLADDEPHPEVLITGFLRYVRETVLLELRSKIPNLRDEEIRWCITVPAMWDDHQKATVRVAAEDAGFPQQEELLLALEPDAAAHNAQAGGLTYLSSNLIKTDVFAEGSRFLMVDCGGGTIDITCYTVDGDGNLTEIDREGVAQGALYVNRALQRLILVELLGGPEECRRLEEVAPHALKALLADWEIKKRSFTVDATDGIRLDLKVALARHLSDDVRDRLEAEAEGDDENILISADNVRRAYEAVIPDILAVVDRKLDDMTSAGTSLGRLETVLLAGGFAESRYLQQRLAQHLNGRAITAVTKRPLVAVVEGAVRFAYNPKVRARRAQYTYGVSTCKPFRQGVDPVEKLYRTHDGRQLCLDRFSIFVRNEQIVPTDEETPSAFLPIEGDQGSMTFRFYRTRNAKPEYVDEKGCEEFADCDITIKLTDVMKLPLEKRGVTLYVTFGETEVRIRAVVTTTGEDQLARLQFSTR